MQRNRGDLESFLLLICSPWLAKIIYLKNDMQKVDIEKSLAAFKPESCVFVISVDQGGKPNGMIAGWSMRCSGNPPLYAVSLSKGGYTHKLIHESKEFLIAVPNKNLEKALRFFGSKHGDRIDKFRATRVKTLKAQQIKSPLLAEATLNFECKLVKEINCGDHIIFIGKILAAHLNPHNKKILLNMGSDASGKWIFKEF